jgi:hypothetical protein
MRTLVLVYLSSGQEAQLTVSQQFKATLKNSSILGGVKFEAVLISSLWATKFHQ